MKEVNVKWPNNESSKCEPGELWLKAAIDAKVDIPTGCLNGSCGACEIEVNGEVTRACIGTIPNESDLNVEFFHDPYW